MESVFSGEGVILSAAKDPRAAQISRAASGFSARERFSS